MAPQTIAICKIPEGEDPISPLPVRIHDFPSNIPSPKDTKHTTRFLSGRASATKRKELQDLKTKYEETKAQLEEMKREKNDNNKTLLEMVGLVSSTQESSTDLDNDQQKIEAIMKEMDEAKKRYDDLKDEKWFQSDSIQAQNKEINEMDDLPEEEAEQMQEQMAKTEELEQQVMLQEMEVMNLMAEMEQMRPKKKLEIGDQIKQQQALNAAKLAEIQKMEEKLANMQKEQEAFKSQQSTIVKPTEKVSESPRKAKINKFSPWNTDLQEKEDIVDEETELDVVVNSDIVGDYEDPAEDSQSEEQNLLSLPTLEKKTEAESVGTTEPSITENSQSLESIAEETENEEEIEKIKAVDSNSDTSATKLSISDDDASSKTSTASSANKVEIMQRDDGSIEAISYAKQVLKRSPSQVSEDGSSSNESSECDSSESAQSSAASSSNYTSDTSTQSSSRSILEQIPEEPETDYSDADTKSTKSTPFKDTEELQAGSLILRKQLEESESKYEKLMEDYKQLLTKSQMRAEKLQEENRKLRDAKKSADPELEKKLRWLKQENKMLLASMEKQNEVLDKANKNYEKLQQEHSETLAILEEKNEKLANSRSYNGRNYEDYHRLRALHETVVMKLADMGEDNDRLEKERDAAIDALESKLRAYDGAVASLNKTEYDLKMLENVHGETIVELQQLGDKHKELQAKYDKEVASAKDADKLEQDYIKVKTEMEMLMAANQDLSVMEKKLNAAEVKIMMLEDEDKNLKEKLLATKQKSKTRADQLKDVIAQYKEMKEKHDEKSEELERLKIAAEGLKTDKGVKEMKKMTDALQKVKKDLEETKKGKKARESDLKIVLQHYEKLQVQYREVCLKIDTKEAKPFDESSNASHSLPFDEDKKEEDAASTKPDAPDFEKLFKESQESCNWRDKKIVETVNELKAAKEEIASLEAQKKELEVELSEVKSSLLMAQKEAENAEEKQDDGEEKLQSAVSKQNQLQTAYDSLLKKFNDNHSELQKLKNEIKTKEEEEKQARERATTIETDYKKLQEDHSVVVEKLGKLTKETGPVTAEC